MSNEDSDVTVNSTRQLVSIAEVSPLPKRVHAPSTKRRSSKVRVLTSSPHKRAVRTVSTDVKRKKPLVERKRRKSKASLTMRSITSDNFIE